MLNKQLSGAVFERVVHIEGRQRDESDFFFQKFAMAASNKLNSDEFYRFEKRHKELLKLKV